MAESPSSGPEYDERAATSAVAARSIDSQGRVVSVEKVVFTPENVALSFFLIAKPTRFLIKILLLFFLFTLVNYFFTALDDPSFTCYVLDNQVTHIAALSHVKLKFFVAERLWTLPLAVGLM